MRPKLSKDSVAITIEGDGASSRESWDLTASLIAPPIRSLRSSGVWMTVTAPKDSVVSFMMSQCESVSRGLTSAVESHIAFGDSLLVDRSSSKGTERFSG